MNIEVCSRCVSIITSDLPGAPTNAWTTKLNDDDYFERYDILGSLSAPLVRSLVRSVKQNSTHPCEWKSYRMQSSSRSKDCCVHIKSKASCSRIGCRRIDLF